MSTFRTKEEAVAAMQRWFWYVSGLEPPTVPGDVLLAFFDAVGFEVEQLSAGFQEALEEGVNRAAYSAFGLDFPEPATAQGQLVFSRATPAPQNYLIPAGTRAQAINGEFAETLVDVTLLAGETSATVAARALNPGTIGNFPAQTVTLLVNSVPGVEAVNNPNPFTGGRDATAPEERQAAFQAYIRTLAKGTYGAIVEAALSANSGGNRLTDARVLDCMTSNSVPPGHVWLLCYRPGGVSLALRQAVEQAVEGDARAAGVFVHVITVQEVTIDLNLTLWGSDGAAVTRAQAIAGQFMAAMQNGEDFFADRLQSVILEADPTLYRALLTVTRYQDPPGGWINVPSGTLHVPIAGDRRAVLGTLNITFEYRGAQ